ncbi:flagellar biosynthetic protein FliR [Pseudoruegeria sp. HB172150]|uniref:flagellar biosynthetic protein FliR n=1 Tax=Pseudoruegeria sp. HB172150 TaxID=2721164 RepID=UPI0015577ACD|nr:flagellar biosynthetic protein FliR [Pseudoruegeria sp. HB172150]
MTAILADLLDAGRTGIAVGLVVFLRIGAVMALLPAFSERSVPERVRLVLTLAFTLIVAPAVTSPVLEVLTDGTGMLQILLSEVVIGLAFGLLLRMFVIVLQTAGSIAAQSTSLSQILGSAGVEPLPAMGHLMVISGLALAVMAGLHLRVAEMLIGSYQVFPPGRFPAPDLLSAWGAERVAQAFRMAFALAAPFVIASLIYNVALGVINKAMPQLMVAFVGAPAITAGGLILLFLTLPLILKVWSDGFFGFLADPYGGTP